MDYFPQALLLEVIITESVFQVYQCGILTQEQRKQLINLFLYYNLSEENRTAINRLLHGIRRGWLRMAD